MDSRAVVRLQGKPDSIDQIYWVGDAGFNATFVGGRLTTFERIEPLPLHGPHGLPNFMTFFDPGSAVLSPQGEKALEMAAQAYEEIRAPAIIAISAHTDGSEAQLHGPDLSQRRGEAAKNRLVALDVPGDRIEVRALRASSPFLIVPPGTAEAQNRRVEISVQIKRD